MLADCQLEGRADCGRLGCMPHTVQYAGLIASHARQLFLQAGDEGSGRPQSAAPSHMWGKAGGKPAAAARAAQPVAGEGPSLHAQLLRAIVQRRLGALAHRTHTNIYSACCITQIAVLHNAGTSGECQGAASWPALADAGGACRMLAGLEAGLEAAAPQLLDSEGLGARMAQLMDMLATDLSEDGDG